MERIESLYELARVYANDACCTALSELGRAAAAFDAAYSCLLAATSENVVRRHEDHPSAKLAELGARGLGLCDDDVELALLLVKERYSAFQTVTLDEISAWSDRVLAKMGTHLAELVSRGEEVDAIAKRESP